MRLTPEQVAEEKKYLSELKERVWFGEHGLTSAEQDLLDTIEALQQENEQLRAQIGEVEDKGKISDGYHTNGFCLECAYNPYNMEVERDA